MIARQKLLKMVYPVWNVFAKLSGRHEMKGVNEKRILPHHSFYDLSFSTADRPSISMSIFKGKKILIVNTASECVYTTQYSELQKLQEKFSDRLVVIGFPSNEFKEQEKGNDEEIARFCSINFGVKFPVARKSKVRKGDGQHPVFQWLTDTANNGWNGKQPVWNFSKYLVDEKGVLTHVFGPPVSPLSKELTSAII